MQSVIDLFDIKDLIPHGYCLSWSPVLLWLHVISDLLITLAYYSIPLTLIYFIRHRKDFPYTWLVTLFAGFIVACGTTHLLSVITIWIPLYWLDGLLKAFTAIISLATAVLMLWVIPRALSLPSAAQLENEIQQRNVAQLAQQEAFNRLNKIASRVPGLVYQYRLHPDGSHSVPFASENIHTLFRLKPEEVREDASKIFALVHPGDRESVWTTIQASAQDLTPWKHEFRVNFDDGTVRWLFGNSIPEREANGETLWHGFITDITERKQMEEKLRDSEAFSACILNSLNSQIAVLDRHGVIIAVNDAWREFGKENGVLPFGQDMLGHNYLDACKNVDESNAIRSGISAVMTGQQKAFFLEYPCDLRNQRNWFHMSVLPLQNLNHEVVISHENITGRKQAERVLVQLKAMIDISLDGFWIVDLMGNLLQVNEAYAKMSGYSIDELLNMPISQLEDTEGPERIKAHIAKVVAQGHDLFETRHRHKDGHLIDIEISVAFLPEDQQFCVFCRNITARKHIENELKASEAKFRSLIDISPVPMALNDGQLNISLVNPAFVKTFGYTLDDIPTLADWWPKAYPNPDYRQWVKSTWQMTLKKAEQQKSEFQPLEVSIRCKNNSIKTVLASAAAIDQSFSGLYLVILYDITRRIQTEAKLNAIFNASVEGIITFDESGFIVSVNTAVHTIFGYTKEELVGCSMSKIIPSAHKSLRHNIPLAGQIKEIEGLHKNGSLVPLELSIAEYSIDNDLYFTAIVRDVSLRKHREKQDKEHLNQLAHITRLGLMGEMASGIAHEVNQPLSAISNYTQVSLNLINTENTDLAKLSEILLKTQQQALRAGRIIHRMRDFVTLQSKHRSTVDINTLLYDAVNLCITELNNHNIHLTFNLQNHLPKINVDHVQIEQVIINLIRNSIDILQKLPENQQRNLSIHSQLTPKNDIQVRIKDNGAGIDESQQQKILMPFYTTKSEGMGMGLSISRSIIEAHEGMLHFNSRPGKGSTFYFILPSSKKSDGS